MNKISAVILTKNSQRLLKEVLQSLSKIDEIVILDNGSEDATLEIAKRFSNVSIYHHDFIGFGAMKKLGSKLAKNDWILSIDSDEIASRELIDELLEKKLEEDFCYSYDVKNYFNHRHIKSCGWYPDRFCGIYHRHKANFDDSAVHEKIISLSHKPLKVIPLQGHISHYPYQNTSEFLAKMQKYTTLYAQDFAGKKQSSPLKACIHSLWCFFKNYLLQKGFLEGYEGFVIASYNAQSAFWKYIKLYEANKERNEDSNHQTS
ncbi:glycosyltransferase family 2 protein [Helicobacter mesocricetorum]|uniref:glycosyltransferase family 2 protein n=1 Tax=Helicobacter mesocricetorum TaxID=87012 RepID=UPI001F25DD27|nr:glycosyltransferase family 2 protein [Helicobacter mesocricetorum]